MDKKITFRGMDRSPVIEEHINKELEKLNTFLGHEPEPVFLEFILESDRDGHHQKIEIRVKTPNYYLVSHAPTNQTLASDGSQDVYAAINMAVDKMETELRRAHRKMVDEKKSGGRN